MCWRESLELLGVIEDSCDPDSAASAAAQDRPLEDLTREELMELARKQRVSMPGPSSFIDTKWCSQASRNGSQPRALKRERTDNETSSQRPKRARTSLEGIEVVSERNIKKERLAANKGPGASFEEPLELD